MIPGLQGNMGNGLVVLSSDENDVDILARIGSPSTAVDITILVTPGTTIGGSPALDLTGLAVGSAVSIINRGDIRGQGGFGGEGDVSTPGQNRQFKGGGGGGGAGTPGGALGPGVLGASDGTTGGTAAGSQGVGGVSISTGTNNSYVAGYEGQDGGHAIAATEVSTGIEITIDNADGNIWGGGGGGEGGLRPVGSGSGFDGYDGGDYGKDGDSRNPLTSPDGYAGYAVLGVAGTVTFTSGGTNPNVKGIVS